LKARGFATRFQNAVLPQYSDQYLQQSYPLRGHGMALLHIYVPGKLA
jgi:hypothetical protein